MKSASGALWVIFLGNLSMREMSAYASPPRRPVQTVGVEVGREDRLWGRECSGNFSSRQIAWQRCIWQPVFLAGNHITDEQRDKEQERAQEKRRLNLRNLSEKRLERSRGRRRRENFNEEHR